MHRNQVIARLPEQSRAALVPQLSMRKFARGEIVVHEGDRVDMLIFPERGLLSLVARSSAGEELEVCSVDRHGAFGSSFLLPGHLSSPWEVVTELEGEALTGGASELEQLPAQDRSLHEALQLESLWLMRCLSLTALCRAFHPLTQRLARSLLTMEEAAGAPDFAVTHELLARVLGAHRPSITVGAAKLHLSGAVEFTRSHVRVTDRRALEQEACSCYREMRDYRRSLIES